MQSVSNAVYVTSSSEQNGQEAAFLQIYRFITRHTYLHTYITWHYITLHYIYYTHKCAVCMEVQL